METMKLTINSQNRAQIFHIHEGEDKVYTQVMTKQ